MNIEPLQYISQEKDGFSHLDAIQNALEAGCKWIQLRVKNQPEDQVRAYAFEARKLCNSFKAKLIINDYPAIAKEVSADGVHLGLNDMSIVDARKIVGKEMIIGGTANTLDHIKLRISEGADYIGLGPFRFTTTKEKLSPILGLEGYKRIMQELEKENLSIPIVAIGAIEPSDIKSLIQTGLYGVAISGAITYAENRIETVENIYRLLGKQQILAG